MARIQDIIRRVRTVLLETKAPRFWSDDELVDIANDGISDLWGAIIDLHQDHYLTIVADGSVTLAANTSTLTGVPADCFRIQLIEPLDITSGATARGMLFVPRKYNHPDFVGARTQSAIDPSTAGPIYFQMTGQGAPVGAPVVQVAPQISATTTLRLAYNPVLAVAAIADLNPVPGQADNALKAWIVAYARAKERDMRDPDPAWLQVYETAKQLILIRLTPRQEQDPDVVESLFEGYGHI